MKNEVINTKIISVSKKIDKIKIVDMVNKINDNEKLGEEIRNYIKFCGKKK